MSDDNADHREAQVPGKVQAHAMPKWLLYGLIAKGIVVTCVVIGVLWYAGIFK